MTWIFVWDTNPSKIYVGDTQVSKVFVGDTQVRPTWWHPWANTIAYYPLNSTTTVNDMSGNNRTLTEYDPYGNVNFWTYNWVDCCKFGGGRLYTTAMASIYPTGTILLYANTESSGNNVNATLVNIQFNWYVSYRWLQAASSGNIITYYYPTAMNAVSSYNVSNTTSTRVLRAIVKDNASYKVYKNGVLVSTNNGYGGSSNTKFYIGQDGQNYSYYYAGTISNVIVEDKAWTASEIQDYFNNTKSNYWIS